MPVGGCGRQAGERRGFQHSKSESESESDSSGLRCLGAEEPEMLSFALTRSQPATRVVESPGGAGFAALDGLNTSAVLVGQVLPFKERCPHVIRCVHLAHSEVLTTQSYAAGGCRSRVGTSPVAVGQAPATKTHPRGMQAKKSAPCPPVPLQTSRIGQGESRVGDRCNPTLTDRREIAPTHPDLRSRTSVRWWADIARAQ